MARDLAHSVQDSHENLKFEILFVEFSLLPVKIINLFTACKYILHKIYFRRSSDFLFHSMIFLF